MAQDTDEAGFCAQILRPDAVQSTGSEIDADGSVDLSCGPEALQGKGKNGIRILPGRGWFPVLRFYGPLPPFLDKRWKMDDIEIELVE